MAKSRSSHRARGVILAVFFMLPPSGFAQDAEADPYASTESWLCRPGRKDLCSDNVSRAILLPGGAIARDEFRPDVAAKFDCFYVYPTISEDPNGNSGMVPGPGERRAVEHQFSYFSSLCRPFAPMYRQVTLAGLRSVMTGKPIPMDADLAYRDVLAAWKHYLKYDNQGRGVVLIGHSQGTRWLAALIRQEIEGTPSQASIISAVLAGANIEVPRGQDRGGTFKQMPVCRSASQTGCVISFVSFRSSSPPPMNARYGRTGSPGMEVACIDPVALSNREVDSLLPVRTNLLGGTAGATDWKAMAAATDAPFVALPGLIGARCASDGGASYLSISLSPDQEGNRPKDIPGDLVANGRILDDWGLHLLDINLVAGNLLDVLRRQADAFLAGSGGASK